MMLLNWKTGNNIFYFLCIVATVALTFNGIGIFYEDKDVSILDYKVYNSERENVYPSFSMYFRQPFIEEKLKAYGNDINSTTYSAFLKGIYMDERMFNISYDEVTIDVRKHLLRYDITYTNYTIFSLNGKEEIERNGWKMPYVSYQKYNGKAFAVDIPFQKGANLLDFQVVFKRDMFPGQTRPQAPKLNHKYNTIQDGFEFLFHYPGQFLNSDAHGITKWSWPKLDTKSSKNIVMDFTIRNVGVLKIRNKRNRRCYENLFHHDTIILDQIMDEAGCRPPYRTTRTLLPLCIAMHNISRIFAPSHHELSTKFDPPCKFINKVQFDFEDVQDDFMPNGLVKIKVNMMGRRFTEIEQRRAYSLESLVGNVGGYLGLFLGYAFAEVPTTLLAVVASIKHWILVCLKKKNIIQDIQTPLEKTDESSRDVDSINKNVWPTEGTPVDTREILLPKMDQLKKRIETLENERKGD